MPKADPQGTPTGAESSAPKNGGATDQRAQRAQAQESREAALERAFGETPEDDLETAPAAESEEEESSQATPEVESSPAPRAVTAAEVAALEAKIEALEERLADERERQAEPQAEVEYNVDVPQDWDPIKPALTAVGKRAEEQYRQLAKKHEELVEAQLQIAAKVDLAQFVSRHPDFWKIADEIAAVAKQEGLGLYDYKSLQVGYDLVRGRKALTRLQELESKQATANEMKQKAGAAPRFRSTQQQVRDENVAPGNRLLTFDQAWEKGLGRLRRSQRR